MVFEKIAVLLAEKLECEATEIKMETEFSVLGIDSLDVVDLVMSLEDEFGAEIPDEEVENIRTVGDIVKYLENNL